MQHSAPLGIASSSTVLVLDWLLFAQVSAAPATAVSTTLLAGALVALMAFLFEGREGTHEFAPRSLRALGAGVAVAIPLPVYGTLVATSFWTWTYIGRRQLARRARTEARA